MFSKPNKIGGERATPSIIASGCHVKGDIVSEGEIQIDGRIDGDIKAKVVVIGEKGAVEGAIVAEKVRVLGSVTGQISAAGVELAKTAKVTGDIHHDSLEVAAGAFVEGRFNRLSAQVETPALPLPDRKDAGQALLSAPSADQTATAGT